MTSKTQKPVTLAALPTMAIERDMPMPYWAQLAELLEGEILSGRWSPGTRLPSEPELSDHFGLSRTTVRQALARLERQGLVTRRKGQGTFVGELHMHSWLIQSPGGFFDEEVHRMSGEVTSRLVRGERGPLPQWAREMLKLPEGSSGATLERLRLIEGRPALLVVDHVPPELADAALAFDDADESLYQRLRQQAGVEPAGGRRRLQAVKAEDQLAESLEVRRGAPLIFIESVVWDRRSRPCACCRVWLNTDRMEIDIEVTATDQRSSRRSDVAVRDRLADEAVTAGWWG